MTLIFLCSALSAAIAIATMSWLTVGAVRDWRRARELARLNASPEQQAGA